MGLKGIFAGAAVGREIDEELRLHVDMLAEELERGGMTREAAYRTARRRLGSPLLIRERGLDVRGPGVFGDLVRDLGFGFRILRRNRWFTIVAVLTLGVAIGANTVILSVVNSLLLRALPYPHADRLVVVWSTPPNHPEQTFPLTTGGYLLLRDNSRLLESVGVARLYEAFTVTANADEANWERVQAQWFTPDMSRVLGVQPALGRWPGESDNIDQAFVVVSHGFWQRTLGGAGDVVGRKIRLDLGPATITGVMPPGFELLNRDAEIWIRQAVQGFQPRGPNRIVTAVGRLKAGVTLEQLQGELTAIAPRFGEQVPEVHLGWGLRAESLQDVYVGRIRKPLLILQGAVFLVFVIACANVAGLLLAQGVERRKELAVRSAIGSSRWRIVRQLVVETVLLSLIAGLAGLALASAGLGAFVRVAAPDFPRLTEISMDMRVFGIALLGSLATGLLFGTLPSMQASRLDLANALGGTSRGASAGPARQRLRSGFVVLQISLAVVLLVGSGLLVRSLLLLNSAQVGFSTRGLIALQVPFSRSVYYKAAGNTPSGGLMVEFDSRLTNISEQIRARLQGVRGVESATVAMTPPLGGAPRRVNFVRSDVPTPLSEREASSAEWYPVAAEYFDTLRIPLVRGRAIGPVDTASGRPVAVINAALARRFFGSDDALGRTIQLDLLDEPAREVIGVAGDVRQNRYETMAQPQMYIPQEQLPRRMDLNIGRQVLVKTFIVRTKGAPPVEALRGAVREIDPTAAFSSVRTVDDYAAVQLQDLRQYTALLMLFGTISALLCAIGVFGVTAHTVTQRTNEIGVRIALGAPPTSVLRLVLGQGLRLVAAGAALGMVAAVLLTQVIRSLLWGITPADPITFAAVSAALVALALLACYFPARRALKIDPIVALRID
jgi:putative ABC transport system permease protein